MCIGKELLELVCEVYMVRYVWSSMSGGNIEIHAKSAVGGMSGIRAEAYSHNLRDVLYEHLE